MDTSRLRTDIDRGRTGDKSPGLDPAVAPLGTDEEAAGTPVAPATVAQTHSREARPDGDALARQNAAPAYEETVAPEPTRARGIPWWAVAVATIAASALAFAWLA